MIAVPAIPPTTPPTTAPVGVDEEPEEASFPAAAVLVDELPSDVPDPLAVIPPREVDVAVGSEDEYEVE
jgi:hypothetical protein